MWRSLRHCLSCDRKRPPPPQRPYLFGLKRRTRRYPVGPLVGRGRKTKGTEQYVLVRTVEDTFNVSALHIFYSGCGVSNQQHTAIRSRVPSIPLGCVSLQAFATRCPYMLPSPFVLLKFPDCGNPPNSIPPELHLLCAPTAAWSGSPTTNSRHSLAAFSPCRDIPHPKTFPSSKAATQHPQASPALVPGRLRSASTPGCGILEAGRAGQDPSYVPNGSRTPDTSPCI